MKILQANRLDLGIGALSAFIFLLFSFQSFSLFESLERIIYGMEMRLNLPQGLSENKIAIVNIDEKSERQLGRWPWPRSLLAEMTKILKGNGARLVALDLALGDKEQNQGLHEVRELQKAILGREDSLSRDQWLSASLRQIEDRLDNDRTLSEAVKECGNVVLPVVGRPGKYESELVLTHESFLKRDALKTKVARDEFLPVNQLTAPYQELSERCYRLGHMNLSPNTAMKGYAHLLFIDYRGHVIPSMPLQLALHYLKKQPEEIIVQGKGIRVRESVIPAQKGEVFIKFRGARRSFPYYSFVDILNVKKVPAVFENKVVIIGSTSEGTVFVPTPVDPEMPQVEIVANVVDNLMGDRFIKRPSSIVYLEGLLLILLTMAASFLYRRFHLANRVGFAGLSLVFVFVAGIVSFVAWDTWLKTTYIGLSLVTVFIALSVKDFLDRQKALDLTFKESIETTRMLGLSLQSQGLLDLAFEKFRKCPLDDAMKEVIYNLGLDYERKRMMNKAIAAYQYITQDGEDFRDLVKDRIPKLMKLVSPYETTTRETKKEGKIVVSEDLGVRPTVGRYEILGEVGQGAMGVVYKASDPKINRLLAIKTIRFADDFEGDKAREVKDRFLHEAEIAGKLSHPSIVAIYDVGEDYDLTYIAMEFLEGVDLNRYCNKGSLLPLPKVLYILGEAASALDYAHSQGVVHRDVKPANIMILKTGHVKVTDFGIAKAVSASQTKSGVVLGTPNYMSPEQINGQPIDGRSDMFSLGVVMYQLLTGQLPFHGKNIASLFYQITQVKHPPLRASNPRIPKACDMILDKVLEKDPENRFKGAGDFARNTKALLEKLEQMKAQV